jgi:hypothetical protein
MRSICTTFILILFALTLKAQDTTHYSVNLASTGSLNKTNTSNAYLFNNDLILGMKNSNYMINSNTDWAYGRQNGILTNNDFSSIFFTDFYVKHQHFFFWLLSNYTTSYSLKITSQFLGGGGIAYNFIDKKNVRINLSYGVVYDEANLTGESYLDYQLLRNSLRFSYHFHYTNFTLDGSHYFQPAFADYHNYIIKSNILLTYKIQKYLNLISALSYNKFTVTHQSNFLLTYGLNFIKTY